MPASTLLLLACILHSQSFLATGEAADPRLRRVQVSQEECPTLEAFNATIEPFNATRDYRKISIDLNQVWDDGFSQVVVAAKSHTGDADIYTWVDGERHSSSETPQPPVGCPGPNCVPDEPAGCYWDSVRIFIADGGSLLEAYVMAHKNKTTTASVVVYAEEYEVGCEPPVVICYMPVAAPSAFVTDEGIANQPDRPDADGDY
ncbi:unnamed protein product [Vitrella brassicaformis CCMP3155]|uniref:Uncharacterized protein n=1 Tax=Vitrella brassicaformis (strain CCMP3155) TaxID=1169540 RepID=A0A0G4F9T5_VITBC|nr:unnamed protein product [Vitrella brassicaformis CCMP3155]|eukprot:CEM09643.1 unnamed protein product [Vitrella brassicaformis CCMP3155]